MATIPQRSSTASGLLQPIEAHAPLGLCLLLAVALRLPDLGQESYWLDELVTIDIVRKDWHALLEYFLHRDVHPPLYFALLKLWVGVFGLDEAATRAFSVLAGTVAVVFGHLLARRVGNERAGWLAAALLACSPLCVYYSREARPYSLLLCLSIAASYLLLQAAPRFRWPALVPYAMAAVLLLYTHVFGAFIFAAHAVYIAGFCRKSSHAGESKRRLLLVATLVAIAYLPWLPIALRQTAYVTDGFWIPAPDPGKWVERWQTRGRYALAWVSGISLFASIGWFRLWVRRRYPALLIGAGMVLPVLLPLALSILITPIFRGKYAIGAVGLMLVTAGTAVAGAGSRSPAIGSGRTLEVRSWLAIAASGLLVLIGSVETLRHVHGTQHRADWRTLGRFASDVGQTLPVVMDRQRVHFLRHYVESGVSIWPLRSMEQPASNLHEDVVQRLEESQAQGFWLLSVHPARLDPRLKRALHRHFEPVERREWFRAQAWLWVQRRAGLSTGRLDGDGRRSSGPLTRPHAPRPTLGAADWCVLLEGDCCAGCY